MGSKEWLELALENESKRFKEVYDWLQNQMPSRFFQDISDQHLLLIVHNLMGLHLQDFFSQIHLTRAVFVLSLDTPDTDVEVLSKYRNYGIKNYQAYVSKTPFPNAPDNRHLRISQLYFTEAIETVERPIPHERIAELKALFKERSPDRPEYEFDALLASINTRFIQGAPNDRLAIALDMYFRAQTRDHCQYEVQFNHDWEKTEGPSLLITLAWRNTPKHDFLFQLAKMVRRHGLCMQRVNATYINPYGKQNTLIMGLRIHGIGNRAAWDVADINDFLRELVTSKFFSGFGRIDNTFVDTGLLTGNLGNLLKTMTYFVHQVLVNVDRHLYTLESCQEAFCRHPELALVLIEAFADKFHPDKIDLKGCKEKLDQLSGLVSKLDTGHAGNDTRRKNVLHQGINFIKHVLKTNFYRNNKTAFSFRLDPHYLDDVPFDRVKLFPELPYSVFFIKGMHYIGYHVRFRDLSRGGLRTVFPERAEDMAVELNHVFSECYNLAYTQQKKNKDIPEGGAKGVIFLKPYDRLEMEAKILSRELRASGFSHDEVERKTKTFVKDLKQEYLHQTQRTYVDALLTLVNCNPDGSLRAKNIVDYYKKPEFIYLGPDEQMAPEVMTWIANHSLHFGYVPGLSFISSKPVIGINHKEYGVTSLGVNVYMHETLKYLGIDPKKDRFTVKISGGPDGDVAGNQILNLYRECKKTAKVLALTDVSGTIFDPQGLDLEELVALFKAGKPIAFYPPEKLNPGGLLLDRNTRKDVSAYVQQTLLWRREADNVVQSWLSGSETATLFQTNVHQTKTDIFIPAGGRPRTLHKGNVHDFLDREGNPTARAIIEGANLYLTGEARRALEKLGVIIIKDSSANKCGVICSSFEVLSGLVLAREELIETKDEYVAQVLDILADRARDEAKLLLNTYEPGRVFLTDISDWISERINMFTDQLLSYLETVPLSHDTLDPLVLTFLNYCPKLLRTKYRDRLLSDVPDSHKKAIIASTMAAQIVYKKSLSWSPTIVDCLPVVWKELNINEDCL